MIYLYAITDRPGAGLPDPSLREVAAHGVAAVFTEADLPVDPTPDALWAHEDVVERLMRERAVLPMRFGTRLADIDSLRALLEERAPSFCRTLDGVRGRVELSVRVAGGAADEGPGAAASGTDYMRARLEARRTAESVARAVHEPLAQLAERSTADPRPRAGGVLAGSYLVPGGQVDRFTEQVRALQDEHPALAVTCTGPWPPYSFVEEAAA